MISEKELFDCFMKHLPGVAFIKDGLGRYLFINDKAAVTVSTVWERPMRSSGLRGFLIASRPTTELSCRRESPSSSWRSSRKGERAFSCS